MNWKLLKPLLGAGVLALLNSACGDEVSEPATSAHDPHGGGGSVTELAAGFELFVEYPHQIEGVESEEPWEIYLTRVEDWKPVEGASVTILLHGPGGLREELVAEPEVPGVYHASPTLPAAGFWHTEIALSVDGGEHLVEAGEVEVFESEEDVHVHAESAHTHGEADAHAGHDHAEDHEVDDPHAGHDHGPDEEVDDAHEGHAHAEDQSAGGPGAEVITLAKGEQWSIPFAIAVSEEREIPVSIPAAGELVAPPGGLVHVSVPVSGLVQVDGPQVGPGDFVRGDELLALIAPISLDDSYARTRADFVAAQLEADRAERLFAAGAIPQRRVEESRRNLEVAAAAFEAIGGVVDSVDDPHAPTVYHLRSPFDGVIATRAMALGQQVEVGDHAFTIVDASSLWFVARVPARHATEANRIRGAWFSVEGGTSSYTASRVHSVGTMIDPLSRTLPVRFEVGNSGGALKVGMLAEGHILLGDPVPGVAVPTAAIQDEDNLSVVYVKLTGDTFERRVVQTGPSDGFWTIVSSGIDFGEQVVTVGAYQVNLAALGVVEPSDGHAH